MTEQQIEKERAAFEAFFADSRKGSGQAKVAKLFDRMPGGDYAQDHTQRHWWTWQNARRAASHEAAGSPTPEAAHEMGAKGGPIVEAERLAFEAWMRGHCWALCSTWSGRQYVSDAEQGGNVDPRAMNTRQLWAAWRDRAALAAAPQAATKEQP